MWSSISRASSLNLQGSSIFSTSSFSLYRSSRLFCSSLKYKKGVPSAESSRSVRGLGKGVSGKPYPRLCNARRPRLEPGTFRSQDSDKFVKTCRPILDPIASVFHRLLCGRSERSDARGQTLDASPLPGSDSIEANRRRLAFVALSSVLSVHYFFLLVTFCS